MNRLFISLIFISSIFSQQETVAIIPFDAAGIPSHEALQITNRLQNEFVKLNKYTVVERGKVEELFKELGFHQSGCTDTQCAIQVGLSLGAQFMVMGSIGRLGSLYTISARLVDITTTKSVITSDKETTRIETMLTETVAEVAAELCGKSLSSKEGITDEKIIIGNIQDLSGPVRELGLLIPSGSQLYFDYINAQGGVNGRQIKMLIEDHGYNTQKAVLAAKKLIEKDQVFCLFNVMGTSPVKAIMPILNEYKVPLIAPFSASEDITKLGTVGWKYIFQIDANYKKQTEKILEYILDNFIDVKLGVIYQNDDYGADVLEGTDTIERKYNLSIKKESFERGATDFVNQTTNMMDEGVTDIIIAGIVREPVTVMKTAEAIGYKVRLYGTSPTADPRVPLMAGESAENYITSYSLYLHNSNYSGPKLYRELCEKDNVPEKMRNLYHYYGFATAHVLVEGLKRAGNELTRKNFIDSMESINNWDNGFMLPITFGKYDHQGIEDVQFWQVNNGNWIQLK